MNDIIFYPKTTFVQQCCWNCKSENFIGITLPIHTNGIHFSVNVCKKSQCIKKCISDLDTFFNMNNVYIVFDNVMIDFADHPDDIMKVNIPRSHGIVSSWFCYGCKNDLSSFLVYESLSSSSLSKSVRYHNMVALNSDEIINKLRNIKVMVLEKLKMNILKNDEKLYNNYIQIYQSKNEHANKMEKIKKEIEYLPLIGIKYIHDFETKYKPEHNLKMEKICMEIRILPEFNNFQGGIEYLESLKFFNENK